MFEINPYMTAEAYMRRNERGQMEFCEEGNGTAMTYLIIHLITDGADWKITKIEETMQWDYEKKSRDQRFASEITGTAFEQAENFFKNTQSESRWIDQHVQQECDGMGEREYDKFRHEAA